MDVISTFCRMVMFPRRNYYFMNMSLHILRIITFERRKLIAHHDLSRAKICSTTFTNCVAKKLSPNSIQCVKNFKIRCNKNEGLDSPLNLFSRYIITWRCKIQRGSFKLCALSLFVLLNATIKLLLGVS